MTTAPSTCRLGSICLALAIATAPVPGLAQRSGASSNSAASLGYHIRVLASNPRDLTALLGAGRAALEAGDANAAVGFFVRADQASPRSVPAKLGLASALVHAERPDDALRYFDDAERLGAREAEFASDRGLARDLRGEFKRAQADYALALKARADDETTRRYALSLGISGQRREALALLDPLLRRQDQGAWRARAFILAMTGDLPGANGVARSLMAAPMAASMAPFLSRLATLSPAERAAAVHFGSIPSDGTRYATLEADDPFSPPPVRSSAGDGLIPAGEALGRRPTPPSAPSFTGAPWGTGTPTARVGQRIGTRVATVDRAALPPEARGEYVRATPVGGPLPPPSAAPAAVRPTLAPPQAAAVYELPRSNPPPTRVVPTAKAADPARLASVIDGIEREAETTPAALPDQAEIRARAAAEKRKTEAAARAAAAAKTAREAKLAEVAKLNAHPARTWVQVASGPNAAGLPLTWKRIREANADALKGQVAWSVPFKATNRLLVGPLPAKDARALVNALGKAGATIFTSEAGQEIVRLAAR